MHNDSSDSAADNQKPVHSEGELPPTDKGVTRRRFIVDSTITASGLALISPMSSLGADKSSTATGVESARVKLRVNGKTHSLELDPRVTLLDALRERLAFTGTKKGCDHGQCGACTVLVDGRRVNSCLTLAVVCEGAKITT
ncbi:MAG: hypothetical protein JWN25_607, partial [Verrucomicrobiales bacterium]|nr:hypothetical protein [Verrucomicrobiales bacterium]